MALSPATPRLSLHALATSALVAGGSVAGGVPLAAAVCIAPLAGLLVFWWFEAKRAGRLELVRHELVEYERLLADGTRVVTTLARPLTPR